MKAGWTRNRAIRDGLEVLSSSLLIVLLLSGVADRNATRLVTASLLGSWRVARVVTLKRSQSSLENRLNRQTLEFRELEQIYQLQLAEAQANYQELETKSREMFEQGQSLQTRVIELEQERRSLDIELKRLTTEYNAAIVKQALLQDEAESKEKELRELDLINERLQVQLSTIKANLIEVWSEKLRLKEQEIHRLATELKANQQRYEQNLKKAHAEEDAAREGLVNARQRIVVLEEELAHLKAPKRLSNANWFFNLANEVGNYISDRGMPVDVLKAMEEEAIVAIDLKPHRISDHRLIPNLCHRIQDDLELPVKPIIHANEDFSLTVHVLDKKRAKKVEFIEPQDWIQQVLIREKRGQVNTYHARFVGESESGKSTLVVNSMGCVQAAIPTVQFTIADPVYSGGESGWEAFNPQYRSDEEAYQGLIAFYQFFLDRQSGLKKKDGVKIFILDEFDTTLTNHPDLKPIVKALWKQGRHQDCYLWAIGQSPLVADFGLRRDDVQNVVGLYLGTSIPRAFGDCFIAPKEEIKLLQEYHARRDAGQYYLALCRPKGNERVFIAQTPKEGTYAYKQGLQPIAKPTQPPLKPNVDYYSAEFDVDAVKQQLEASMKGGSEDSVRSLVLGLHHQGKTVAEIVETIWKLKPSRSNEYKQKKQQVEAILKET